MIKGFIFKVHNTTIIEPGDFPKNCSLEQAVNILKESQKLTQTYDPEYEITGWLISKFDDEEDNYDEIN